MLQAAFSVWDGRIAPVFDTARVIVPVSFSEGVFTEDGRVTLSELSAAKTLDFFQKKGVQSLICGAISRSLQNTLEVNGIEVIGFISGDLPEVMRAWVEGRLDESEFRMPGCGCGRQRRRSGKAACPRQDDTGTIQKKNCRRWGGSNQTN